MRLLIPFISLLLLATTRADNGPLETWLKRQATITTLDADFVQERKLPALKNPVSTKGRISFAKPDKVRWQLGDPVETLAVSDGETFTLVDTAAKTARRTGVNSPQAARFSLLSGRAFDTVENFQQTFEIIESRVTLGIHQYTLKPKDRKTRSQIPWIFLDIDPVKNELRAMEMELQDKSRLRTVFQNVKFNGRLDDALFKPDLTGYDVK
ncbi:outer-membrane lipoprotein carrier protein LolA [Luteolibacter yonseiensis]|uniref:Outer-membrane lipoprotein carrier protein LolA n=1 Tax=Luteolibacter yonseiensis TaxID=1144680 RepID=A0A934V8T5_9BACT|nr:outer-membrane lipoprotein carrier protein LolA [Luteolibacter yonseiensis]MBK1817597.1 outer-membrane lipoprotein carrier protein LolA [Luteolibacter yonseiensis]